MRIDTVKGTGSVKIEEISPDQPLYRLKAEENMAVFHTDRYDRAPLVIKGAASGPELLASAVFADGQWFLPVTGKPPVFLSAFRKVRPMPAAQPLGNRPRQPDLLVNLTRLANAHKPDSGPHPSPSSAHTSGLGHRLLLSGLPQGYRTNPEACQAPA